MKPRSSRRTVVGFFEDEQDILNVTRAVRGAGLKIVDVYAPYAVHGLDRAMGLEASRLPLVCFLLGLFGAAFKVWFEIWTSTTAWPINVGGKPLNSLPAFVPVTFEVMVLFAGLSTVFAFFIVRRFWPGKKAYVFDTAVTNDHFVLVLEETDAAFDHILVRRLFRQYNAARVEERVEG